ncbi:MmcQ/YjbR family DNA-binding protein [Pseudovibrio sp. Tun.PSC04-5.I4]|uniref:MmcQ/YjbR family DNA-binding protein n=1 Tax=Pseudovibrio sp. Tun.PSC04-5.I4 TaxID=1798213 RepID=UPI000B89461C|nr:MmcQ/YjbR family DNA-binding protein [Pseudovibrio sp. Tun.PSC04-5.I4]
MIRDEFDIYCKSLIGTTNVVQWGNASVWKVGGKIFAICSNWGDEVEGSTGIKISFKCSELSYQILTEQDGIIPAPYLARAKWVQIETSVAMEDQDIKNYVREAHSIIARKLTKKLQREIGFCAA